MKVFTSNQKLQFLVAFHSVKSQYEIKMYYARYLKKKDNNNKKKILLLLLLKHFATQKRNDKPILGLKRRDELINTKASVYACYMTVN